MKAESGLHQLGRTRQKILSVFEDTEHLQLLYTAGKNAKIVWLLRKTIWQIIFVFKLNMNVPYDPSVPLLDIYLRKIETYVYKKASTQKFVAALFIIT